MRRRVRWSLWIVGCLAVLAVIGLVACFIALRHVPAFYDKAMKLSEEELNKGSEHMLRQIAALHGASRRPGHWKARITAEEINGWLAVDLVKNHPRALPPGVSDARVAIRPEGMTLACRAKVAGQSSILSLTVQPYMPEPDVVALRLMCARAGALPVPLGRVLDRLSQAARALQLPLQWRQAGGDPVAMLALPGVDGDQVARIDAIELGDGWIDLSGTTARRKP